LLFHNLKLSELAALNTVISNQKELIWKFFLNNFLKKYIPGSQMLKIDNLTAFKLPKSEIFQVNVLSVQFKFRLALVVIKSFSSF